MTDDSLVDLRFSSNQMDLRVTRNGRLTAFQCLAHAACKEAAGQAAGRVVRSFPSVCLLAGLALRFTAAATVAAVVVFSCS